MPGVKDKQKRKRMEINASSTYIWSSNEGTTHDAPRKQRKANCLGNCFIALASTVCVCFAFNLGKIGPLALGILSLLWYLLALLGIGIMKDVLYYSGIETPAMEKGLVVIMCFLIGMIAPFSIMLLLIGYLNNGRLMYRW